MLRAGRKSAVVARGFHGLQTGWSAELVGSAEPEAVYRGLWGARPGPVVALLSQMSLSPCRMTQLVTQRVHGDS